MGELHVFCGGIGSQAGLSNKLDTSSVYNLVCGKDQIQYGCGGDGHKYIPNP